MLRIKKNDNVEVLNGKEKGKRGKILQIFSDKSRAIVENVNMVKKARRRTQQNQQGGIVEIEASLALSNLMLVCKQCNKRSKFRVTILKDGTKIRECKKCGAAI